MSRVKNDSYTMRKSSNVEKHGIVTTHEQASDAYMEGTIDQKLTKANKRK